MNKKDLLCIVRTKYTKVNSYAIYANDIFCFNVKDKTTGNEILEWLNTKKQNSYIPCNKKFILKEIPCIMEERF